MMKVIRILVFNFIFVCILCQHVTGGESAAEKYLGERLTCLQLSRMNDTMVLDDQTILFRDVSSVIYLNRLPDQCVGLRIAGAFSYATSIDKLCKQDIIKVHEDNSSFGSVCGLGEFIRLKDVKTMNDAAKLLRGGVLDELVKEGAFETAFPSVTDK